MIRDPGREAGEEKIGGLKHLFSETDGLPEFDPSGSPAVLAFFINSRRGTLFTGAVTGRAFCDSDHISTVIVRIYHGRVSRLKYFLFLHS
jgi:hypothetical protein